MLKRLFAVVFPFALAGTVHAADGSLVITHVNVVDVISGAIQRDMTVVVRDGKISNVGRTRRLEKTPRAVTTVDASGKFLIPGLWDMHAHIRDPQREIPMLIANGVLGVRDVGGVPEKIFRKVKLKVSRSLLHSKVEVIFSG